MRLYADDTSLTVSGKNIDDLLYQINRELPNMHDWLCVNKLTLNLKEDKISCFSASSKIKFQFIASVNFSRRNLEESVKYKIPRNCY